MTSFTISVEKVGCSDQTFPTRVLTRHLPKHHKRACLMQGKLLGVVTCESGAMAGLKTEAAAWGSDVKKVIALCHDLVPLSKGQLAGSLEEKKAFKAVEAAFMVEQPLNIRMFDVCPYGHLT